MITEIEDYFARGCGRCARFDTPDCSTRQWAQGLADLHRICIGAGLTGTAKWGHPCYMHGDRNIALLGAFRGDFRITYFNAALMQDPDHVLEPAGPNAQVAGTIRFTANDGPSAMEPTLRAYLTEAIGYADAGLKPKREPREIELPDELIEALDADPELAEAFHALTPGRQCSHALVIGGAKASATRHNRVARARDRILAGKGANER